MKKKITIKTSIFVYKHSFFTIEISRLKGETLNMVLDKKKVKKKKKKQSDFFWC